MSDYSSSMAISCSPSNAKEAWQELQAQNAEILKRLNAMQGQSALLRKDHYSLEEIAEYVGRSAYTVRRWIKEGRIKAVRLGGPGLQRRLFVPYSEVQRLFE